VKPVKHLREGSFGRRSTAAPWTAHLFRRGARIALEHHTTQGGSGRSRASQGRVGLHHTELKEPSEIILKISCTDALTGLANRRTLDEHVFCETDRTDRLGTAQAESLVSAADTHLAQDEGGENVIFLVGRDE
jgi:hypothetical protein